jgi:hypothetical protein
MKRGERKRRKARQRMLQRAKKPEAAHTGRRRIFLETSGVIYHRHGHSLMEAAVHQAIGSGLPEVSTFIRMEYLRGVVLNFIELYFLIKESESLADALIDWSQKVKQERKLKIALMTISQWLVEQEDSRNKEKSMRRLGDLIIRLVYEFDEVFQARTKDRLRCQLGRVRFPHRMFSEHMLLRFYERFKAIQASTPDCDLCKFKMIQQAALTRKGIDLYSTAQRHKYGKNTGYIKQAERVEEASNTQETMPNCRWCERLGDTIITLQAPAKAILVTADRAFEAFGEILNREIRLLPSLAQLKQQLQPPPPTGAGS